MDRILGYLSLAAAAVLWGSSFIAGKYVLGSVSFPLLVAVRFLVSGGVLLGWMVWKRVPLADIFRPRVLLLGFLTVTATYLLQFAGLSLTSAVNATVVIGLEPMVIPLVGFLFFKEKFPVRLGIFGALAAVGVWVTVGNPAPEGWLGIGLVFVSTIVVGFWIFLTKRLMKDRPPLEATGMVTWGGLATLIPVSALLSLVPSAPTAHAPGSGDLFTAILALGYLGIFCTLGATFLWNWGLNRVSGGISGLFLALEPLVGVLLAVTLLGEPMTASVALGTALVLGAALAAIWLDHRK